MTSCSWQQSRGQMFEWKELVASVDFPGEASLILGYFGAVYRFDDIYSKLAAGCGHDEFPRESGRGNRAQLVEAIVLRVAETTLGRFQDNCDSHVAAILFASRVCRADCSTADQRLCAQVSRLTTADDDALVRLRSYLKHHADSRIAWTCGPKDLANLDLRVWTEADRNYDPGTAKSTRGSLRPTHATRSRSLGTPPPLPIWLPRALSVLMWIALLCRHVSGRRRCPSKTFSST